MSLLPMTRQCVHCRRTYRYNPSTGDLGLVCRYCGKAQCSPEPQHPLQPHIPCQFSYRRTSPPQARRPPIRRYPMSIYKAGRPWKFDPTTGAGHRPPNSPGEYRMRDGSGCITYIGETNDLARRMREHIRSGKLPTGQGCGSTLEYMVADGRSTSRTRREHEQQSIEKHHPTLNRSKGGEGRPAGK